MTQFQHKMKSDAAWRQLYDRLKTDGLLSPENDRKQVHSIRAAYYKWAAVAAVICIAAATVFIVTHKENSARSNLLTLQNEKSAATLVATLEDGSIIYLAGDAKLDYPPRFEKRTREVHLTGNALFEVSGNKERPFLIDTQEMLVEVLGTSFYIKDEDNASFELAVRKGLVKVTHKKSGRDTFVETGETVRLSSGELLVTATENDESFQRYTEKIQFKDELLGNILRVINKKSDKVVVATTPELSNRLLTVTFSNDSPERITQLICGALNLTYTEKNGVLFISDTD